MWTHGSRFVLACLCAVSLCLVACGGGGGGGGGTPDGGSDPDPDPGPADPGFEATLGDFEGYETWPVLDYTTGAISPRIDDAHAAGDERYSRIVRIREPAPGDGAMPRGTILLLETFTWNGETKEYAAEDGLVALVKRGGDFDPAGDGWEYMRLSPDLSEILGRGDSEFAAGSCADCHAGAEGVSGRDRVFPHPVDRAPVAADFADHRDWPEIDAAQGFHPQLGGWHQYSGTDVRRRVYKSPIDARPIDALGGYPTGTRIVKSVENADRLFEITAMGKRGGGFAPDGGNWEWFEIDRSTLAIRTRGADLVGGACANCHEQAGDLERGLDYVFRHPGAPFNR